MLRLALVQAPACPELSRNLETIRHYTAAAAQAGCHVICFPECSLTGYSPEEAAVRAIDAGSPALRQLSGLAGACGVDILAGFMEKTEEACHITHGLFRRNGTRDLCRKTHLGQRERLYFSPGHELKVLTLTDGTRIGIQLCVETHFPEITQTLALRGAELIFAPHASPRVSGRREEVWGRYIPARSYDNRVYMACCNLWDESRFGGGCLLTDPRGEVAASCFADEPSLLICSADPALSASFRDPESRHSRHFYPALRRRELYG